MTRSVSTPAAAAAQIVSLAVQKQTARQCFLYCPATGLVDTCKDSSLPPFLTVTGGEAELGSLLACYEGWVGLLKIGVLCEDGLLDFWVC